MASVADLAVQAYLPVEMQFFKTHTELVSTDDYFKQFEPFFKNGFEKVDWILVEQKMASLLRSLYVAEISEDVKKLAAHNINFFITIKDVKTKKILGYTVYYIMPYHPQGAVWCGDLGVAPEAQKRGLGKLLIASIFKIIPEINRIMLCTRITNETAFNAYKAWGFTEDQNPIENPSFKLNKAHWRYMEYKPEQSNILQKVATSLAPVEK